jgi:hypothetical protein
VRDGVREQGLDLHENGDFVTEFLQVSGGQMLGLAARRSRWLRKNKERLDLIDAEFELTRPANEPQPEEMVARVIPMPARCARWRRDQSGTFVIANGGNSDACFSREKSNRHPFHSHYKALRTSCRLRGIRPAPGAKGSRENERRWEQAIDDLPAAFRVVLVSRDVEELGTGGTATLLGTGGEGGEDSVASMWRLNLHQVRIV